MGCVVEWGAALTSPGVCTLTSEPDSLSFHMGRMDGITEEKFLEVKNLLELMCPVHEEPTMLQDLKKNKPCEIEAINGIVCQFGRKYGVKTPFNDKIVEIVKNCEKGVLKPGMKNIDMFKELL